MRSVMMMACVLLAACGGGKKAGTLASGGGGALVAGPRVAGFDDGALWTCQISDYDPQPCKLTRDEQGAWQLAKLLGSQRFRGSVAVQGDALAFDGEFFCPWGDCTAPMQVTFLPAGDGFATQFSGDEIRLRWDEGLASEWGGAGYGGLTGAEQ